MKSIRATSQYTKLSSFDGGNALSKCFNQQSKPLAFLLTIGAPSTSSIEYNQLLSRVMHKELRDQNIPLVGGIVDGMQDYVGLSAFFHTGDGPVPEVRSFHMQTRSADRRGVGRWPGPKGSEDTAMNQPPKLGQWANRILEKYNGMEEEQHSKSIKPSSSKLSIVLCEANPDIYALSKHCGGGGILGAVSAKTPFITGTPHCLFHNQDTLGSGIAGLQFTFSEDQTIAPKVSYPPLEPLSSSQDWLTISKCQGNILMEIDGKPALQHLMEAINRQAKSKEYLLEIKDPQTHLVRRITGGDPAGNGHFAVDYHTHLTAGTNVRFVRLSDRENGIDGKDSIIQATKIPEDSSPKLIPADDDKVQLFSSTSVIVSNTDGIVRMETVNGTRCII